MTTQPCRHCRTKFFRTKAAPGVAAEDVQSLKHVEGRRDGNQFIKAFPPNKETQKRVSEKNRNKEAQKSML